MPLYRTSYLVGATYASRRAEEYGNQLWARGEDHARELCERRCIGEKLLGTMSIYADAPTLPSEWIERALGSRYDIVRDMFVGRVMDPKHVVRPPTLTHSRPSEDAAHCCKEALHAACWLGYVAQASGAVSPMELLNDNGLIHELSHAVAFGVGREIDLGLLVREAQRVEHLTPGFTKC